MELGVVFVAALATAFATGLGAVPFLFGRDLSPRMLAAAYASAGGLMLAATFALVQEGFAVGPWRTVAGVALGIVLVWLSDLRFGDSHEDDLAASAGRLSLRSAFLLVAIMTLHSFAEGIGVGVAYGAGNDLGGYVAAAIAIHNIPEGLAISVALIPAGASVLRAAWWSVFSSLPQPLMAIPAFLFVEAFADFLPVGLGFAGGAMVWVVLAKLMPAASAQASGRSVATVASLAMCVMLALQLLLQG